MTEYRYNVRINLGKDRQYATQTMTAAYITSRKATGRGLGQQLWMDYFFFSPELFDDLHKNYQLLWGCQT